MPTGGYGRVSKRTDRVPFDDRACRDEELVELSMSVGSWLTFGRINRIFGLDAACVLPHDL